MESERNISSKLAMKFLLPSIEIGHDKTNLLKSISESMALSHILAAMLKEDVFIAYIDNISSFRHLLMSGIRYCNQNILAYPILNIVTIKDVAPSIRDSTIMEVLKPYGDVEEIETLPFCTTNSNYLHIRGAERRVFIHVPLRATSIPLPLTIPIPYKSRVKNCCVQRYCYLCKENGHFTLECFSMRRVDSTSYLSSSSSGPLFIVKDFLRPSSVDHSSANNEVSYTGLQRDEDNTSSNEVPESESQRDDNASPIEIPNDVFCYLPYLIKHEPNNGDAPAEVDGKEIPICSPTSLIMEAATD